MHCVSQTHQTNATLHIKFQIMQKQEFTQRTDIQVSDVEYKEIELMYLEAGNMDKDEFCQDYKKHKDSILLATFYRQSERLKDKLDVMRDERSQMVDFLLERAQKFGDIELLNQAIKLVGHKAVIMRKIDQGLALWDLDKEYIRENIQ